VPRGLGISLWISRHAGRLRLVQDANASRGEIRPGFYSQGIDRSTNYGMPELVNSQFGTDPKIFQGASTSKPSKLRTPQEELPGRNFWGGKRESNPQPSEPQSGALPVELFPPPSTIITTSIATSRNSTEPSSGASFSLRPPRSFSASSAVQAFPAVAATPARSAHSSKLLKAASHCNRCRSFRSRTFFSSAGKRSNVIFAG
jgi:hypothetical protein